MLGPRPLNKARKPSFSRIDLNLRTILRPTCVWSNARRSANEWNDELRWDDDVAAVAADDDVGLWWWLSSKFSPFGMKWPLVACDDGGAWWWWCDVVEPPWLGRNRMFTYDLIPDLPFVCAWWQCELFLIVVICWCCWPGAQFAVTVVDFNRFRLFWSAWKRTLTTSSGLVRIAPVVPAILFVDF